MTRLFIRFYVGVLTSLALAMAMQTLYYRVGWRESNKRVIEDAFAGGAHYARVRMEGAALEERPAVLAELTEQFRCAIRVVSSESQDLVDRARPRIERGESPVWHYSDETGSILYVPLGDGDEVLILGPFSEFKRSSSTRKIAWLAGLLALLAIVTVAFVRSVVRQLRTIEDAAFAIAGGDLNARIDEARVPTARPVARAFNSMADRIATLLRTQRELLQAVSHELRTPLSRIRFGVELLASSAAADKGARDQLEKVDDAIQELDDLVGELLRYVRLETGERQVTPEEVQADEVIGALIATCGPLFPRVVYDLDPGDPGSAAVIRVEPRDFQLALRNLLLNAGRFAQSRVQVQVRPVGELIEIDVDDDGPGVAPNDRERIFEPFVRSDNAAGGVGLGLALVKRILERHGGSVVVEDSPLGGSRFRTRWPKA